MILEKCVPKIWTAGKTVLSAKVVDTGGRVGRVQAGQVKTGSLQGLWDTSRSARGGGGSDLANPDQLPPDKALGAETGGGVGALTGMGCRSWGCPSRGWGRRRWTAEAEDSCRMTSLPPGGTRTPPPQEA